MSHDPCDNYDGAFDAPPSDYRVRLLEAVASGIVDDGSLCAAILDLCIGSLLVRGQAPATLELIVGAAYDKWREVLPEVSVEAFQACAARYVIETYQDARARMALRKDIEQ